MSIGDIEKALILRCYNQCQGKEWSKVLSHVRQGVIDAGLPDHVVNMYFTQPDNRLIGRIGRIIKQGLQTSNTPLIPESKPIWDKEMKYARRLTPSQRKSEAVRSKITNEMEDYSSSDSDADGKKGRGRKRKAEEAQSAHTEMCQKAMKTMDSVQTLLTKIEHVLDKNDK